MSENKHYNREKGHSGEELAAQHLRGAGFEILQTNFSCLYGEIDIIAVRDNALHIIEVKSRTSNTIPGRYAVNKGKQRHIKLATQYFLTQHPQYNDYLIAFDVVEIGPGQLEFLENCFY